MATVPFRLGKKNTTRDRLTPAGKRLMSQIKKLQRTGGIHVRVGIIERDFGKKKRGRAKGATAKFLKGVAKFAEEFADIPSGQRIPGGGARAGTGGGIAPTVGQVGVWNEFGNARIPERSFVRSTADNRRQRWIAITDKLRKQVMAGKMTPKQAIVRMGLIIQKDMRKTIVKLKRPPNTTLTKQLKGSSNPLVDKGQLTQSINFEVRNGINH